MRALAVIGAGYGDEGKGLLTDYLCAKHGIDVVVRYNGGAQAGHTVHTPSGQRHVFSHLSAGSFTGASTFLSRFFIVNPMVFYKEVESLQELYRTLPDVYVDPVAPVTTPYDMLINQLAESSRADQRHGSCGLGINETVTRNDSIDGDDHLVWSDLGDENLLKDRLFHIRDVWVPARCKELGISLTESDAEILKNDNVWKNFIVDATEMWKGCITEDVDFLYNANRVLFEGAQGLLLDQDYGTRPHVTRSNTGLKNILTLCDDIGITDVDVTYATRCYLTRHGAGPMKNELKGLPYPSVVDETNIKNTYQGSLRFGYLDIDELVKAIKYDLATYKSNYTAVRAGLAVTCLDQLDGEAKVYYKGQLQTLRSDAYGDVADAINGMVGVDELPLLKSFGPTRAHVVQQTRDTP